MVRTRLLLALAAGLSCVCSGAAAQTAPYRPSDWRKLPSLAERSAAWPSTAKTDQYEVSVQLECAIGPKGAPYDCAVVEEEVPGQGFGAAALSMVDKFAMKRPQSSKVYVTVPFLAPGYVPPNWLKRPRPEDIAAVWPTAALKMGKGGSAVIGCLVNVQGGLFDCKTMFEEPAGANFGGAAIALTPQLLMKPASMNGKPVVSTVRIPIVFPSVPDGIETGTRTSGFDLGMKTVIDPALSWDVAPTYADVVAAYPKKARESATAGRVALSCGVNAQGGLKNCFVVTEEPKGRGFGEAAKDLAQLFRASTGTATPSQLASLVVQLPVTFATEMLGSTSPVVGKPKWAQLPSAEEAGDAFPLAARKASVWTGRAVLSCRVEAQGRVACAVESETPAGLGFGEAGLKLAPYFRLATWTVEGLPVVGGKVRIPLKFEAPEAPPAAAP